MTNYSFRYIAGRVQSGLSNGLSLSGTFYHTWDKMNTWSRIASVALPVWPVSMSIRRS